MAFDIKVGSPNTLTFTLEGHKQLKVRLEKIRFDLSRMRPVLREIGEFVIDDYQSNIQSGNLRRKFGGGWKPLAASTLLARAKRWGYYRNPGSGTTPLLWTGNLMRGFAIFKVTNELVQIGNKVPYFKAHQVGAPNGSPPKRESLGIHKNIVTGIIQILNKAFNKAIK